MKYLAAYALCALSGKAPTKADVEKVLKAGGVAVDANRLNELFSNFEGKNFNDVVAEGLKKVSSGGGGGAGGAAPAAAANKKGGDDKKGGGDDKKGGGDDKKAAAAEKPAKKKEKTPPPSDEDVGLGGLF